MNSVMILCMLTVFLIDQYSSLKRTKGDIFYTFLILIFHPLFLYLSRSLLYYTFELVVTPCYIMGVCSVIQVFVSTIVAIGWVAATPNHSTI